MIEAVKAAWLIVLGSSQAAGMTLSSGISACRDTCVNAGMCDGPILRGGYMIACYMNTGSRNSKAKEFAKENDQEQDIRVEVTEIVCAESVTTVSDTRGASGCLFDRCTVIVGTKMASECQSPWELRDVADMVYNCTRGDNHRTPTCVGDGYVEYQAGEEQMYIKEYSTKMTWDQASEQCRSDGARLVKLDTRVRQAAIKKYLTPHWIGLRDLHDNDTYVWTDGSPLSFNAWCIREPSHFSKFSGEKEDCVEIAWRGYIMPSNQWNDVRCDSVIPFLCEKLI
ncbi:aggrecan core protein-like [Haliotis cracherodii]|uniref:aggrecan core protein-like n=1 Tax=Haliotis cracherodii TaxID=6455 RepID=UPI0039E81929